MKDHQVDVCIIGSGICGVLAAEKLAQEHDLSILLVEAGRRVTRKRHARPGENRLPGDVIPDQIAEGMIMQTMCVGGRATHWGGQSPRYSPEDFRAKSLTGFGEDWPITYEDLEPFYADAERRIEVSPRDSGGRQELQAWAAGAGIHAVADPHAGVEGHTYSPLDTLERLLKRPGVQLLSRTLIRRLELAPDSHRITRATGVDMRSATPVNISAKYFLLAGSYVWTPHLLLLSANSRFPNGLANQSGWVGKGVTGHPEQRTTFEVEEPLDSGWLYSRQFLAANEKGPPTRFGLFLNSRMPRVGANIRDATGQIILGDAILEDWRERSALGKGSRVVAKTYLGVEASPKSRIVLSSGHKNRWGDPLPVVNDYANREAAAVSRDTPERLRAVLESLGRQSIRQKRMKALPSLHPSGGCRMGVDPMNSVCDEFGRCHDHQNLVLLGAPTCVSGGCVNSTLTFVALALRSAAEVGSAFPRHGKST